MRNNEPKKTISFRIYEDILNDLEKDANSQLTSTNQLLNKILHNYVTWDRFRSKTKMYPISEENINHMLECMDDNMMKDSAIIACTAIKEFTLQSEKNFNLESCMRAVRTYCNVCGFHVDEKITVNEHIFLLGHSLGLKFSVFGAEIIKLIFQELKLTQPDVQITQNTIFVRGLNLDKVK